MNAPDTLSTEEAAALLGLHRVSLMRLVKEGQLKPDKAGNRLRFARADLDAFRKRKCPQCGRAFVCARADQVFCAHACAVAAADARKRDGTARPGRRRNVFAVEPAPVPDRLAAVLAAVRAQRGTSGPT